MALLNWLKSCNLQEHLTMDGIVQPALSGLSAAYADFLIATSAWKAEAWPAACEVVFTAYLLLLLRFAAAAGYFFWC